MAEPYISCIKIVGVPILPPLMTPERRLEMLKYKRKAIDIENRIKSKPRQELSFSSVKTLENSLAFDNAASSAECEPVLPAKVPSEPQLTRNIFDVTEYNDNGIVLFNECDIVPPRVSHSQPRLLRSNSYTLDAPSPVLLERFKQHLKDCGSTTTPVPIADSPPCDGNSKCDSIDSVIPQDTSVDHFGELIEELARIHFGNANGQSEDVYDCNGTLSTPIVPDSLSGTVCYSISPVNGVDTSSVQLIDFESDTGNNLTPCFDNISDRFVDLLSDTPRQPRKSCVRELFVESPTSHQQLKKEWAATILTSAARGYLVRRLKRTERVKTLIQTISDTLLCAMSLHSEQTDTIQQSDVELHRRLIQQISAACYEFYDIFFNLSTKEQMEIISLDRQRIKEKLKRPASTSSSKLDSELSSRSQRDSFHTKQKKAFVTSLVA